MSVAGIPTLALAARRIELHDFHLHWSLYAVMTAVLIAGEMQPIPVPRGDDAGDEVSISSTVALALVMLGPLGLAPLAQALALFADEARGRRMWSRLPFNVAQYALALLAARFTYTSLLGHSWTWYGVHPADASIGAGLVAGAAFFVVNQVLTCTAIALKLGTPVVRQILSDFRYQVSTSGVLLALAPATAVALNGSAWTLPLLLLPIAAVHRSARLASAREHEALHDSLTGLANRTLFNTRLQRACEEAERSPVGLFLIDVDHFKEINDTLGHHAGDLVLVEVANRLRSSIREGDLIARLGGDEFAVLAHRIHSEDEARPLVERLRDALASVLVVDDVQVEIGITVGAALAPLDATRAEQLLQRADVALYAAKRTRGSAEFYRSQDDTHSVEKLSLLGELRRAIDIGEIECFYQPQVEVASGRVAGFEALVRWRHPTLGLLPPARFIPLAENSGLIDALTLRVIAGSLDRLREWHAAGARVNVAVNLSARLLSDLGFVERLADLVGASGVAPDQLTVEITETMIMMDTTRALSGLEGLRSLGVRIAIDDFGTGYSSLAYLKQLQVDELKVDRTFVSSMTRERADAVIAEITVDLGHQFGLTVVAEGVEDELTMHALEAIGCDLAQGFLISPPMPAGEVLGWMRNRVRTERLAVG